ncbi:MAG: hypothetical protein WC310_00630 [Patescibacteria group bacterium]|jgi:hypothetical protein
MKGVIDLTFGPFRLIFRRLGKRYQVRYKFNKKHLVADTVLFLGVVFLIVFNIYITVVFTKWAVSLGVDMNIKVEKQVLNGAQTKIVINYDNSRKNGRLVDAKLSLQLPEDFVLKETSNGQYDVVSSSLLIGEIKPGTSEKLELLGENWGNYDTTEKIYARLDYTQERTINDRVVSWREENITSAIYKISGSMLDCGFILPPLVTNGSDFDFQLNCQNNYDADINKARLLIVPGDGLAVKATKPQLSKNFWTLGDLTTGVKEDLSGSASFNMPAEAVEGNIGFQLYGFHNGKALLLDKKESTVKIFHPHFSLAVQVNGADKYWPIPGEEVNYLLNYQNQEDFDIADAKVKLDFSPAVFDVSTWKSGQKAVWDGSNATLDIGALTMGQKGEIAFSVKTKKQNSVRDLEITPRVSYAVDYQGQHLTVDAELPAIKQSFSANLELESFARYYTVEGEQLGIGPLPPVVGIPTQYRMFWQISNAFNAVKDVWVSCVLPNNVIWTGQESVNTGSGLEFNSKTREMIWRLPRLESSVGIKSIPAIANFSLELTPLVSQLGQNAIIAKDVKISATDEVSGRKLELFLGDLLTNLPGDKKASNRGRIVNF